MAAESLLVFIPLPFIPLPIPGSTMDSKGFIPSNGAARRGVPETAGRPQFQRRHDEPDFGCGEWPGGIDLCADPMPQPERCGWNAKAQGCKGAK
ncbi:MAG: hypothetical protein DME26_12870 [Verrucomicrobia bacterium]|nr:MAG: hypothetical protein DME26_12870 [Verrucomicrobiota bacterium]